MYGGSHQRADRRMPQVSGLAAGEGRCPFPDRKVFDLANSLQDRAGEDSEELWRVLLVLRVLMNPSEATGLFNWRIAHAIKFANI